MTQSLKQLVESAPVEKRSQILDYVAMVAERHSETLTPDQVKFLSVIAQEVFEDAGVETLKEASKKFASNPNISSSLAAKFGSEDIEVAEPMLRGSQALLDRDLVAIIKTKSDNHRLSIAHREALSSLVTDSILTYGNALQALTVTRNKGAEFSDYGFMKLATIAVQEKEISKALSYRGDMPNDLAEKLGTHISVPNSSKPATNAKVSRGVANKSDEKHRQIVQRDHSNFAPHIITAINKTKAGEISASDAIPPLCKAERAKELCQYLAGLADLTESTVNGSIFKLNGTKIAQICKAIDLESEVFEDVALLRIKLLKLPLSQANLLIGQYNAMDLTNAQRALSSMQGRVFNGKVSRAA